MGLGSSVVSLPPPGLLCTNLGPLFWIPLWGIFYKSETFGRGSPTIWV